MKKWIIKTFGLKGSWKWAKKQMMKGKIVRCKHWPGTLKLRVSAELIPDIYGRNPKPSTLLQSNYQRNFKDKPKWETSHHHLSFEDFTDYYVFNWSD